MAAVGIGAPLFQSRTMSLRALLLLDGHNRALDGLLAAPAPADRVTDLRGVTYGNPEAWLAAAKQLVDATATGEPVVRVALGTPLRGAIAIGLTDDTGGRAWCEVLQQLCRYGERQRVEILMAACVFKYDAPSLCVWRALAAHIGKETDRGAWRHDDTHSSLDSLATVLVDDVAGAWGRVQLMLDELVQRRRARDADEGSQMLRNLLRALQRS